MAILVDQNSRVIVQGITGFQGTWTTKLMLDAGTKVVAGVTPGKGGEKVHEVPVFDSVAEAMEAHPEANAIISLVPGRLQKDAIFEDIMAGLNPIVLGAENVPVQDVMEILSYAKSRNIRLIGPDALGVFSPGKGKIGSHADRFFQEGSIGIVGKGGTMTYEVGGRLSVAGLGVSTCVNLGGARVIGTNFEDILELFQGDPETEAVVIVGEIGGTVEERAAQFIKKAVTKPVVALILGRSSPPGKQMGHAGAIIERGVGTFESKVLALKEAGVNIAKDSADVAAILKRICS